MVLSGEVIEGNTISQPLICAVNSPEYSHGQVKHCTFHCIIPDAFILFSKQRLLKTFDFGALYSLTIGHHLLEAGPKISGQTSRIFPFAL